MNKALQQEMLYPKNENGIYLYEYPIIGGMPQYVQMRGTDKTNPLMLVLHGGPGGSMAGICQEVQKDWEDRYTVVNYDQRNTCKTYLKNKAKAKEVAGTGTVNDYVEDIHEVIRYLHTVYAFDKLILLGFSWGSVIGAEYVKKYPEDVAKYLGVGQFVNFAEGYRYICDQMLAQDMTANEKKKVAYLKETFPASPVMDKKLLALIRQFGMMASRKMAKSGKPFPLKAVLSSPFLTAKEKRAMLMTDWKMLSGTYNTMLNYDFRDNMEFTVPVHFIYGAEDISCPAQMMQNIYEEIKATDKKITILEKATHMCFYDQPEAFMNALS
ncbi:MAG: alpha/beta hydrolase [Lachnospiraceae bacterium]|nr:alpha/beta hydrolase [Lachnospiraceae bacterium]